MERQAGKPRLAGQIGQGLTRADACFEHPGHLPLSGFRYRLTIDAQRIAMVQTEHVEDQRCGFIARIVSAVSEADRTALKGPGTAGDQVGNAVPRGAVATSLSACHRALTISIRIGRIEYAGARQDRNRDHHAAGPA